MSDAEMNEVPQQAAATTPSNYWSDGAENLKGTLSSLSLTGLGKRQKTAETNNEGKEAAAPKGGYWEWQENIKKTLSTLSLGNLVKTNNERTHGDADSEPVPEPKKNYWFWRQSFKSKSDLTDGVEGVEGRAEEQESAPPAGSSYWFWRNSSASLNKAAGEDEDLSDGEAKNGPISNLEHKLRSTWRKSFQHLSSNSLTKLDEGEASKPTGWKDNFRSFRESFHDLKVSGSSAKIDEDSATAAASSAMAESAGAIGMDDPVSLDGNSSQDGISF
jgi:hypothetical protein